MNTDPSLCDQHSVCSRDRSLHDYFCHSMEIRVREYCFLSVSPGGGQIEVSNEDM